MKAEVTINVHFHRHCSSDATWVDLAAKMLDHLKCQGEKMSQVIDDLVAQVEAQKTVKESVKTLLAKLFALVQAGINSGDLAKAQAALDDLKAQDQELSDAVTANTPAE